MYFGYALFLLLVFAVAAIIAFGVMDFLLKLRIDSRVEAIRDLSGNDFREISSQWERKASVMLSSLKGFSMPSEEAKIQPVRIMFTTAGYRGDLPVLLYFSAKTLLTFLLPLAYLFFVFFFSDPNDLVMVGLYTVVLAAFGYYAPDLYVKHKTRVRQREIFETFPDALDLMRVCVSAGLGLDAAIARVGKEIELSSVALAEEFRELNLELRAGKSRQEALRSMADRTGVEDVAALVAMLIQSERFGTSVSESLKVHAESLRTKRKMQAQEAAGKIPVKLTIPMILCIFPGIFIVILGPAIVSLLRSMGPAAGP
jgi:tight adherence protein C